MDNKFDDEQIEKAYQKHLNEIDLAMRKMFLDGYGVALQQVSDS